jgi:hypothetical protein
MKRSVIRGNGDNPHSPNKFRYHPPRNPDEAQRNPGRRKHDVPGRIMDEARKMAVNGTRE